VVATIHVHEETPRLPADQAAPRRSSATTRAEKPSVGGSSVVESGMAKHSFSVTFTGTADETVAKARGAIEKFGGTFDGDTSRGNLVASTPAGKVKGTYQVQGQTITIDIIDKPFVVPASVIEAQIRKFLSG
jgi:hypothetical protein